ncbi:hypothetical protein MCOR02_008414 [Pyricularia oryzae]|nr:hypothetical protein MCOR02_008414 [Pyricularia oryzae]
MSTNIQAYLVAQIYLGSLAKGGGRDCTWVFVGVTFDLVVRFQTSDLVAYC